MHYYLGAAARRRSGIAYPEDLVVLGHYNDYNGQTFVLDYVRDGGSPSPTDTGSPQIDSISKFGTGAVDCIDADPHLEYNGSGIVDSCVDTGTVSFWYKPNFSGIPIATQSLVSLIQTDGSLERSVRIYHAVSNGRMYGRLRNDDGTSYDNAYAVLTPTAGTWYHIEFNWDSSLLRMFFDGVLVDTSPRIVSRSLGPSILRIAQGYASPTAGDFALDELQVFDTVQHEGGFKPPAGPMDEVSTYDRSLLVYAKYDDFTNQGFDLDYIRDAGPPTIATNGSPAVVAGGKFDYCLDLAGSNFVIEYSGDNLVDGLVSSGSVSFWYKPGYSGTPAVRQLMFACSDADGSENNAIIVEHEADGDLRARIFSSAGVAQFDVQIAWSPTGGTWYHIEVDFSLDDQRLFLDGVQQGSTGTTTLTRTASVNYFTWGEPLTGVPSLALNYEVGDLRIYDTPQNVVGPLPPDAPLAPESKSYPTNLLALAHYDSLHGSTYDFDLDYARDGGTITATLNGSQALEPGKFINALTFPGTAGWHYVYYSGAGIVDGFVQTGTISLWVRPGHSGTPTDRKNFFGMGTSDGSDNNKIEIYHHTDGNLYWNVHDSTGTQQVSITAAWNPTAATWYHFELTVDATAGATRAFVDGTQFSATDTSTFTRSGTTAYMTIGDQVNGSPPLNNDFGVDELQVYDTVVHTADFTPDTLPLRP
jgi:hypothetical protein